MEARTAPTPGVDARAVDFCAWLDQWNANHSYPPAIGDAFDAAYRIAWKRAAALPPAPQE